MPYIIAVLVIAVLGIGFTLLQSNKVEETPTPVVQEVAVPNTETTTTNDYRDGSHTTKVTYLTPMKSESILDVTLMVTNDIVTDAQIVYSQGAENDPNAQRFETAYRTEVIGKDIDTLNLSRVGGASLTTSAFNEALANIKTDAKS